MPLQGVRFDDLEDLKVAVAKELGNIFDGYLATGIADLPKRWNAFIRSSGQYIEGIKYRYVAICYSFFFTIRPLSGQIGRRSYHKTLMTRLILVESDNYPSPSILEFLVKYFLCTF